MANTHTTLTELFTDIADAIKEKKGVTEPIVADTFPVEIENLKTGFDYMNSDVDSIPDYAFYGCENLINVNATNITSVGDSAFENCRRLKTIILYEGVTSVGENAFKGCSDDLTIYCEATEKPEGWSDTWNPNGCNVVWGFTPVATLDISATENDNVIAKLYNNIYNEGYYTLVISGSGEIYDNAFLFLVDGNNDYTWKDSKLAFINNGVYLGYSLFQGFELLESIYISDGIICINDSTFSDCASLKTIIIPNSVRDIGYNAFYGCTSLELLNIPDSINIIGENAFYGCTSLESITISDSVTRIYGGAFYNTSYYNNLSNWENNVLYINNMLININKYRIDKNYSIKDGTRVIASHAFEFCDELTSINIPNSITSICSYAFYGCGNLAYINIPNGIKYIGDKAFEITAYYNNKSNWENGVLYIDNALIEANGYDIDENYSIKDGTTIIAVNGLAFCYNLKSITIPDSIVNINTMAFSSCKSLESINYIGTIEQWNSITFETNWNLDTSDYTIHCTDGDISKDGTITYH